MMLRTLVIAVLFFTYLNVHSQSRPANEIIAEGGAKIKIKPDVATFTLTVVKTDSVEKNAIAALNKQIDELVKSLNKIGFKNESIKILSYEISSSVGRDEKKQYLASNVLKVNFGIDYKVINAFYNQIQQAGIEDLDVSFDTKVSDSLEKATRIRLVKRAIDDAKSNANNIAQSLGIKIIKVKQVQKYAEGILDPTIIETVKFTPPKIKRNEEIRHESPFDKFQVEDVEFEEKITIIFEISG